MNWVGAGLKPALWLVERESNLICPYLAFQ